MFICDLKSGETGIILKMSCDERLKKRLFSLGCVEGTEVTLKNFAPLGDPLILNIRGSEFALRKCDAEKISVKKQEGI